MARGDSDFMCRGTRCAGWLYMPDGEPDPPVVVMAHGFAAQRDFVLPEFAEAFVDAGMAVFLFDYRNFGASAGEPRNLVSHWRHLEDWRAAVAHVRGLPGIDATRMALWGSSYSDGHVLVTAARTRGISAVVAQVPFVSGLASASMYSPGFIVQAAVNASRDLGRAAAGRSPHYVPVVGRPDEFALMNTPDAMDAYLKLVPPDSDWRNECPARVALTLLFYSPTSYASRVPCPVLMICAENDSLIPARAVKKTAGRIKRSQLVTMPIGHFDIYDGEEFEEAVRLQRAFLAEHLKGAQPSP